MKTKNIVLLVVVFFGLVLLYALYVLGFVGDRYYEEGDKINPHSLKWKFKAGSGLFAGPVVSNGVVYIGSANKNLYALDENSGALKWKFKTKGWLGWVKSSPAASNGVVFVANVSGYVHAVNATTGKERWRFLIDDNKKNAIYSTPVVSDGLVLVLATEDLYALDRHTGKLKWNFKCPGSWTTPVAYNGTVLFGSEDTHFYAVDIKTGGLKWKFKTDEKISTSKTVVSDGIVYFCSWDGHLYALETETGKLKWKFMALHSTRNVDIGVDVWENMVFFNDGMSSIYGLDKRTGEQLWGKHGSSILGVPYILTKEGLLFMSGYDHAAKSSGVNIVNARIGRSKWKFTIGSNKYISRGLAESRGVVFFGSYDKYIYAVEYKKK